MRDLKVIEKEFGDLSAYRDGPAWWVSHPHRAQSMLQNLKQAVIRKIGHSAGGREIIAIEYGQHEPLETITDNLHSALASKVSPCDPSDIYPAGFFGSKRRTKPVVVLQGAIHGGELSGTVASLNLCQVIETGCDLRGKAWPRLAQLARRTRILIIPWLNPDGTSREPLVDTTQASSQLQERLTQGIAADGTAYKYPQSKIVQPIPPERTAYMGTYYNDAGVNLQYDLLAIERQPETVAWMKYYLAQRPDGVVIWHCNAGSMLGPTEYYLPPGVQMEATRLAGAVLARLRCEGLAGGPISRISLQMPGMGKPYLEQLTGVYMVCGATPLLVEMPCGGKDYNLSLDRILDIGLLTIEEILAYADTEGLRAYETWEKVKRRLGIAAAQASK